MPSYRPDNGEITEVIEEIAAKHHEPLVNAGVTFDVMVAIPSENDGSDLVKLHGRECYAVVQVTPYKLRCRGMSDVTLWVDGPKWDGLDSRQRKALIDHELLHLELQWTKSRVVAEVTIPARVKTDDLERPKIKLRPHDWEIGGFDLIVNRWGDDSIEIEQCKAMVRGPVRQALLPFMNDAAIDQDVAKAARDPNAHGLEVRFVPVDGETIEIDAKAVRKAERALSKLAGDRVELVAKAPGVTKTRTRRSKAAATG